MLAHGDALLSTFPRLIADLPLCRVFMYLWSRSAPYELGPAANPADITIPLALHPTALSLFKQSVLSLWKVSASPTAKANRLLPYEAISQVLTYSLTHLLTHLTTYSLTQMYERENVIREMVGLPPIASNPVTSFIPDTLKPILGTSKGGNNVTLQEKQGLIAPLITSRTIDSRSPQSNTQGLGGSTSIPGTNTQGSGVVNKIPVVTPPPDKYLYSPFDPRELMYTQRNQFNPSN